MNIIVKCAKCGGHLNVTNGVVSPRNEIVLEVSKCQNKKCDPDFCKNCEDVVMLCTRIEVLREWRDKAIITLEALKD